MSKRLEQLGAEVARIQDETLADDRRRAAVRRRLLSNEAPTKKRALRWAPAVAWAGAMTAIALAIVVLWPSAPEPLAYRIDEGAESSAIDRPIDAPANRASSIVFTDGSSVRLGRSGSVRVRQLRTDGATLALDRGEAFVSVRHRQATSWSVEAGPFLVRVTGTRFRVRWQPESEAFDLEVLEGEVHVSGPSSPEQILGAGDELHRTIAPEATLEPERVPVEDPVVEPVAAPKPRIERAMPRRTPPPTEPTRSYSEPSAVPPPSSSRGTYRPPPALKLKLPPKDPTKAEPNVSKTEDEAAPAASEPEPPTEPTKDQEPTSSAPPPWKAMLDEGRYDALLTELGPSQLEQALWQAAPRQLIDLGAAARHLRDNRAGYIYSVARSRFPGTDAAADAAFVLGRMQFHSGTYRTSATWFETYLRERPDGRFAREAAGRVVEAYDQSGDDDRARDAAEEYLRRYPNGPHAGLARSVLE